MNLDLSALDNIVVPPASDGSPLALAIDLIDEDPDQPREQFDEEALAELADSIKARGVKSPISVRPHPESQGRYIVNHGARRLRAARRAGLETIPAFLDVTHAYVDQLAENIQRENLSTREIIDGVGRLLASGKGKAVVAKELGKSNAWVSRYVKLQSMPVVLAEASASGRCRDADALGVLAQCWETDPAAVERLLSADDRSVTKLDADRLRSRLDHAKRTVDGTTQVGVAVGSDTQSSASVAVDQVNVAMGALGTSHDAEPEEQLGRKDLVGTTQSSTGREDAAAEAGDVDGEHEEGQGNDGLKQTPAAKTSPPKNKKPQVQVKVGRREAILLLTKPCDYGLAWVEYEDESEELLDANRLRLVAITDGKAR